MTTSAPYPTVEEVRGVIATGPLVFLETNRAMVEAAINIERERVAKESGVVLDPIARDEAYDRDYIPLPGGWEVQTQGFGSTFRLCSPSGDRIAITDGRVQEELQKMALDIRAAYTCQPSPAVVEAQNSAVKVPGDVLPKGSTVCHSDGEPPTIKIYSMDNCTWYAAESEESAIAAYAADTGTDPSEMEVFEVSDLAMDSLKYTDCNEDETPIGAARTFREQLAIEVAAGTHFPCLFATTEY